MVARTCIPSTRGTEAGWVLWAQISLGYMVSLRPVWITQQDLVSKNQKLKTKKIIFTGQDKEKKKEDSPLSNELLSFLYQRLVDYVCVCLFVGTMFCFIDPRVYSFSNTTLSYLLQSYSKCGNQGNMISPNLVLIFRLHFYLSYKL